MTGDARSIEENVETLVAPVLEEMGIELVGVEYLVDRGRWILRTYIDKPGGVTVDNCALVSREIGVLIEVKDLVPGKYVLEVSSPGLNRLLRRQKDFDRAKGKKVKIGLKSPLGGRSNFTGYLSVVEDESIYLDVDGHEVVIPFKWIKKANIEYEF